MQQSRLGEEGGLQSLDWTGGLDWWTGLVDWTSGLIEIVCKPLPGMHFDNVGYSQD